VPRTAAQLPAQYKGAIARVRRSYAPVMSPLSSTLRPQPTPQPGTSTVKQPEIKGGSIPPFLLRRYIGSTNNGTNQ
jgi:hypothetical protein